MKKLLAILAATTFVVQAQAADTEMSTSAEYRLRYEADQDADFDADAKPSTVDSWDQRVKLGLGFKSGGKFAGQVTMLHNATWGSATPGENGTDSTEDQFTVNEAYGSWMMSDEMSLKFGRMGFEFGDGTVMALNDYEAVPYSFEGLSYAYDTEFAKITAFALTFSDESPTGTSSDPEDNVLGLLADFKNLGDFLKMANLHIIQQQTDRTTADASVDTLRYGVTLGGDAVGLDYRLTYTLYSGETQAAGVTDVDTTDLSGNMMDLEVGYSLPETMNLRFYVYYHADSGWDEADDEYSQYDSFFYDKNANAGAMDVIAWGNLKQMSAGFTLDPADSLTVGLHYHQFTSSEEDGDNTVNGATVDIDGEDALGTEIDLTVDKKYEGGLTLRARYGQFTPGDAINPDGDAQTTYHLQGLLNF